MMGNCPNCGKKMDRKQNAAIKVMNTALEQLQKTKDKYGLLPKASNMFSAFDEFVGVDYETFKEFSEKGWCLECITKESKGEAISNESEDERS